MCCRLYTHYASYLHNVKRMQLTLLSLSCTDPEFIPTVPISASCNKDTTFYITSQTSWEFYLLDCKFHFVSSPFVWFVCFMTLYQIIKPKKWKTEKFFWQSCKIVCQNEYIYTNYYTTAHRVQNFTHCTHLIWIMFLFVFFFALLNYTCTICLMFDVVNLIIQSYSLIVFQFNYNY